MQAIRHMVEIERHRRKGAKTWLFCSFLSLSAFVGFPISVTLIFSTFCIAEVQLRGNHFERQEMDQLREQLISTFREQMDVRRHLMELENNYMEIQIESSRHLLTIAE